MHEGDQVQESRKRSLSPAANKSDAKKSASDVIINQLSENKGSNDPLQITSTNSVPILVKENNTPAQDPIVVDSEGPAEEESEQQSSTEQKDSNNSVPEGQGSSLAAPQEKEEKGVHTPSTEAPETEQTVSEEGLGTSSSSTAFPMQRVVQESGRAGRPLVQIAPMLDVTYQDFRYFIRLLSKKVQLWSEMHVQNTLIHSPEVNNFLRYDDIEHPIVCQLGGADPESLAKAVQIVEKFKYDEINLNVGCPSDRVCGKGKFGATLMLEPELVSECVKAMKSVTDTPITVKTRLGIDKTADEDFTSNFISVVEKSGCEHFIMHARKAWLKGLSPAQNRSVPPLNYAQIYSICYRFPHLQFSLNGGIKTVEEIKRLIFAKETPPNIRGIMIGRVAYDNPCMLWNVDTEIYGEETNPATTRRQVLNDYITYLKEKYKPTCKCHGDGSNQDAQHSIHLAVKPILGILAHKQGSKKFRRELDEYVRLAGLQFCGPGYILEAVLQNTGCEALDELLDPDKCEDPRQLVQKFKETDELIDKALAVSRDRMNGIIEKVPYEDTFQCSSAAKRAYVKAIPGHQNLKNLKENLSEANP